MADELRAKIRGSIQRAIETAKKRASEAQTIRTVDKANADMVGQAQALERRGFDDAAERGMIAPRVADQHRAINLTPPPGERESAESMRAAQAETQRFGDRLLEKQLPNYPTDEELHRAQVPPSARGMDVPPSIAYSTDELGQPRANSSEDIRILEQLLADAHDRELDRELSAPLPPPSAPAPLPSRAKDELGRPVPESKLLSDERAKTDIRPSTAVVPTAVRDQARVGAEPGINIAGPGLSPKALHVDPDGGRITADDPRAFLESTIPGRSGLAAAPARQNLGTASKGQVAEARVAGPDPMRKGLAENDAADRRKRALDFMQFSASMPQFETVDVGGAYRG